MKETEMTEEHPFAQYIKTLGKGRHGSRALTRVEAFGAMKMILAGEVEPVQLGAFLMLLRVKEETAEELAGFVQAAREAIPMPESIPKIDLDWSSYAGKRRQLPWYVLSALLLASHGISILMHGMRGCGDRVHTPQALQTLGIAPAVSMQEALGLVNGKGFAFLGFDVLSPKLQEIMNLRPLFGLRSPVHTIARMLNPACASLSVQGIFHPGYLESHQQAGKILGENIVVFKGEGGEAERNPDLVCKVKSVLDGDMSEETWPALFELRHVKDEEMDVSRLARLWFGEIDDEFGTMSVVGTAAIALKSLLRLGTIEEAQGLAKEYWHNRDMSFVKKLGAV